MQREELEKRKKVIYDLICDDLYRPMKIKEMAMLLNIPKEQRPQLREVLDALVREGKIELSPRGKYRKGETKFLTGVFTAHARGFGFVTVEGEEEDIFIAEPNTGGAIHEDVVRVMLIPSDGKRREGKVMEIL